MEVVAAVQAETNHAIGEKPRAALTIDYAVSQWVSISFLADGLLR